MLYVVLYGLYGMVQIFHRIAFPRVNISKRDSDYGSYGAPEVMKVKRSGIDRRSADRRKLRKYLSKIQRLQGKFISYFEFLVEILVTICLRWSLETFLLNNDKVLHRLQWSMSNAACPNNLSILTTPLYLSNSWWDAWVLNIFTSHQTRFEPYMVAV